MLTTVSRLSALLPRLARRDRTSVARQLSGSPRYRWIPAASPFRPQIVNVFAVAGICGIRLGSMRPSGFPSWLLPGSGFAVKCSPPDSGRVGHPVGIRSVVYIPRRESNSWMNVVIGGRIYPGQHYRPTFDLTESLDDLRVVDELSTMINNWTGHHTSHKPWVTAFPVWAVPLQPWRSHIGGSRLRRRGTRFVGCSTPPPHNSSSMGVPFGGDQGWPQLCAL